MGLRTRRSLGEGGRRCDWRLPRSEWECRRTEKGVGETAVPAGNPTSQAVGGLGEVERGVIDVEPVMGEVVHEITSGFMGNGRLDRPLTRSGRAVKPPPMNGK